MTRCRFGCQIEQYFLFIFNRVMSLDWFCNFVYAQYLVTNEWILIKFCLCVEIYMIYGVTNTHYFHELLNRVIFPNFSTELWRLIDIRIMFMLDILLNNWWIWSNLVDTLIFFYAKTWATTKRSTVTGYHVVLATLLFCFRWRALIPIIFLWWSTLCRKSQ